MILVVLVFLTTRNLESPRCVCCHGTKLHGDFCCGQGAAYVSMRVRLGSWRSVVVQGQPFDCEYPSLARLQRPTVDTLTIVYAMMNRMLTESMHLTCQPSSAACQPSSAACGAEGDARAGGLNCRFARPIWRRSPNTLVWCICTFFFWLNPFPCFTVAFHDPSVYVQHRKRM